MKKLRNACVVLLSIAAVYAAALFGCYYFEPAVLPTADLTHASFAFEMYEQFSADQNSRLFIRQITAEDIMTDPDTSLQYCGGTILVHLTQLNESTLQAIAADGFKVTGRIDEMDLIQLTSDSPCTLQDLQSTAESLTENQFVDFALPDYFEVTPESAFPDELSVVNAYRMIGLDQAALPDDPGACRIAFIDSNIPESEYLHLSNYDDYAQHLPDQLLYYSSSHALHVAGIAAADTNDTMTGIAPGARVFSYNGLNNTLSFWLASLAKAVTVDKANVINVSMCYNDHVVISAGMGDPAALSLVNAETALFEKCVTSLIDRGYSFNICCAAGNEAGKTAYRDFFGYFGYGSKPILRKLDFLHVLDTPADASDAETSFFLGGMRGKAGDVVITVGSCDDSGNRSGFSTKGAMILAPGESITSLSDDPYSPFRVSGGTSMATPFVSGCCALIHAASPELSGAEVKTLILETAENGVLRVDKALARAAEHDSFENIAA